MHPAFTRGFRLHHNGHTLNGAELPDGRAIVVDDPEYGLSSIAPSRDELLKGYHGARIEDSPEALAVMEQYRHQLAPQVVYEPGMWPEFLGTDRHADFLSWLKANGIDPDDVPTHAEITVETGPDGKRLIRHTAYLRNEDGAKYLDEATGDAAQEERTAPVQVEPPTHWYLGREHADG